MSSIGGLWNRVVNPKELRQEITRLRAELDGEIRKNGLLTERLANLEAKYDQQGEAIRRSMEGLAHLSTLSPRIDALGSGQERLERHIMSQLEQMDAKLTIISNTETVLGESIQKVVDYLKSNPNPTPTDLTAQLGVLENISTRLIDSNAKTLANLPPTPAPVPEPTPQPEPPTGRR